MIIKYQPGSVLVGFQSIFAQRRAGPLWVGDCLDSYCDWTGDFFTSQSVSAVYRDYEIENIKKICCSCKRCCEERGGNLVRFKCEVHLCVTVLVIGGRRTIACC